MSWWVLQPKLRCVDGDYGPVRCWEPRVHWAISASLCYQQTHYLDSWTSFRLFPVLSAWPVILLDLINPSCENVCEWYCVAILCRIWSVWLRLFLTRLVAGVVGHYQFVLKLKSLSFFSKCMRVFFQGPWVFSKTLKFWRFRVSFLKNDCFWWEIG